jgi:hypothetical protein
MVFLPVIREWWNVRNTEDRKQERDSNFLRDKIFLNNFLKTHIPGFYSACVFLIEDAEKETKGIEEKQKP